MWFTPKLLVAMLVVVFGSYCARVVGGAVHTYCEDAQIPDADLLGRIARYVIVIFVVMIALGQVEVGGDIVQRTFLILLAGLVLALALAFGLGGKEWGGRDARALVAAASEGRRRLTSARHNAAEFCLCRDAAPLEWAPDKRLRQEQPARLLLDHPPVLQEAGALCDPVVQRHGIGIRFVREPVHARTSRGAGDAVHIFDELAADAGAARLGAHE